MRFVVNMLAIIIIKPYSITQCTLNYADCNVDLVSENRKMCYNVTPCNCFVLDFVEINNFFSGVVCFVKGYKYTVIQNSVK